MKPSLGSSSDTQAVASLLVVASTITALSSFLLFGLQPLAVAEMNNWHTPSTVVHFFQWTYLGGVAVTAMSSGLAPRSDLRLAAIVFVPVAGYTILMVTPDGPRRLGHLAPIAVWLACSSTIMVRALGRIANTCRLCPYTVIASSNAGALLGVAVWAHPAHTPTDTSWVVVGTILLIIGASLTAIVRIDESQSSQPHGASVSSVRSTGIRALATWFLLAMSASFAMMLVQNRFSEIAVASPSTATTSAAGTALPLMVFLLAYVVGWAQVGSSGKSDDGRCIHHVLGGLLITVWTMTIDPSKVATSVALYVFCAGCVALLRRFAPHPADATPFQIIQAVGGVFGGWLALHLQ